MEGKANRSHLFDPDGDGDRRGAFVVGRGIRRAPCPVLPAHAHERRQMLTRLPVATSPSYVLPQRERGREQQGTAALSRGEGDVSKAVVSDMARTSPCGLSSDFEFVI